MPKRCAFPKRSSGRANHPELVSKRSMRRCLLFVVLLSACAHPKPAAPPDLHSARLAAAAAQMRAGCLDCLLTAYREYEALKAIPPAAADATAGMVRTAALIAIRQRELGMVDEGYLQRAR